MAEQTYTGNVDTQGQFADLDTLTSLTFTNGKQYTIYIGGNGQVKVGDAVFPVNNQIFYWKPSGEKLKICNNSNPFSITVYGEE